MVQGRNKKKNKIAWYNEQRKRQKTENTPPQSPLQPVPPPTPPTPTQPSTFAQFYHKLTASLPIFNMPSRVPTTPNKEPLDTVLVTSTKLGNQPTNNHLFIMEHCHTPSVFQPINLTMHQQMWDFDPSFQLTPAELVIKQEKATTPTKPGRYGIQHNQIQIYI